MDEGSDAGKRVWLTRKTRPGELSHDIPDPRHPTPRRWKRLRSPSSEGVEGDAGVPRNFFIDLEGWTRFAPGKPGTCLRREQAEGIPAGQSSRRDQCTGTGPF